MLEGKANMENMENNEKERELVTTEEDMDENDTADNVNKFIDRFNNDFAVFRDKMKFLCLADLTDDERKLVLERIPYTYSNYYIALGPDRCKALNYEVTKISKEFSDMQFDKSQLEDEIYKTFTIGERYTKAGIKDTLKNLYKFLGYNKTPKANDLDKYFELKECKVLVDKESGKRDMGFEIIKRKENFDDLFD